MARNQSKNRSLDEWFELVTNCRQSGLSDAEWCNLHGISRSTFGKAISRLREKTYALPVKNKTKDLDFTSKQEVVKINISEEETPRSIVPAQPDTTLYLDNSHTIEVSMGNTNIKICNDANPMLLKVILNSLRGGEHYVG